MEAKDTVITNPMKLARRILRVVTNNLKPFGITQGKLRYLYTGDSKEHEAISRMLTKDRKAQAEISFKAGMREVVNDIVALMDCRLKAETFAERVCDYCEAKLKEWGINDD